MKNEKKNTTKLNKNSELDALKTLMHRKEMENIIFEKMLKKINEKVDKK